MSDELPEGWASVHLRDGVVADAQTGFACGKHSRDAQGVAHLRPMNVSEAGRLRLDDVKFIDNAEVDRDQRWIRLGDVLFNNTNSPELVGKTAVYTESAPRAFSNHMTRLRCTAAADPQFLAHAIHQKWRERLFASICNNHVSQASISTDVLLDFELPVPPLAEQHRIVAKVEALLEQVRRAKDRLDRVPLILRRFRQAMLAAACSGELTEEWRRLHGGEDGAGVQLAVDDLSGGCDDREFPQIPQSWRWVSLRSLVGAAEAFCYGVVQPGADDPAGVPLIRAGDLHDIENALPTLRRIPSSVDATYRRSRVSGGEILVTVVGANIGTVAVVPPAAAGFNIARAVAKVPVRSAKADFVVQWLRSTTAFRWMAGDAREVARPTLNLEQLGDLPVPLPPFAEQGEICRRTQPLLALGDAIQLRSAMACRQIEKLPQAILSKAFAGQLVPTEAELARAEGREYETAEQLLERVRRQQAREQPTVTRQRKRAGNSVERSE